MKLLSKYKVQELVISAMEKWRPLERARYTYHFSVPDHDMILEALKDFQNEDGGFGKGLEPDFWMEPSSAMATSVALQVLSELPPLEGVVHMTDMALQYLLRTNRTENMGWIATDRRVNDYPHAPWWHLDKDPAGDLTHWGNPTMELLGYFVRWQPDHGEETFGAQLDYAQKRIEQHPDLEVHELFCYCRAYAFLDEQRQKLLKPFLHNAVVKVVETSPQAWDTYAPKPLDFVRHPRDEHFGIDQDAIDQQLDYLVDQLERDGIIRPTWEWSDYPQEWEIAKEHWTGILTVNALIQLKEFGRIQ